MSIKDAKSQLRPNTLRVCVFVVSLQRQRKCSDLTNVFASQGEEGILAMSFQIIRQGSVQNVMSIEV